MFKVPEPLLFNPLKHHLSFIREFISNRLPEGNDPDIKSIIKELKHIGTSVMDIYTGSLSLEYICKEVKSYLKLKRLNRKMVFSEWAGKDFNDFRIITLSDTSKWMLKFNNDDNRYVHFFTARSSPYSIRVKANTLKSAILYYILIGKDFISRQDLNRARALLGLSPIKDPADAEAITEMIEMLRV